MREAKVLILEDDEAIRKLLESAMEAEGFHPTSCAGVEDFRRKKASQDFDIYLIDLKLPDGDGMEIARELRIETSAGIIIVTGRADEFDTVLGLELGADDYIAKPFRLRELRARVRSVLRRTASGSRAQSGLRDSDQSEVQMLSGLRINKEARTIRFASGEPVKLTTLEFDVLKVLISPPNRVLSRDQIMDRVRGPNWAAYDRNIDGIISRLRSKLFPDGRGAEVIKTVRGVGYIFGDDT